MSITEASEFEHLTDVLLPDQIRALFALFLNITVENVTVSMNDESFGQEKIKDQHVREVRPVGPARQEV